MARQPQGPNAVWPSPTQAELSPRGPPAGRASSSAQQPQEGTSGGPEVRPGSPPQLKGPPEGRVGDCSFFADPVQLQTRGRRKYPRPV